MENILETIASFADVSPNSLAFIVALASVIVAGFSIHAILVVIKGKSK